MKRKFYLAYGSNLNMDQMAWRCPKAAPVGTASLDGWQLQFRGSGSGAYLTIDPLEGSSVPVGVWSITEADERALDRYEGFPHFYHKQIVPITLQQFPSGKPRRIRAMVYIMREGRPLGLPDPSYIRTCARGYVDFGFDHGPLQAALDRAKKGEEPHEENNEN